MVGLVTCQNVLCNVNEEQVQAVPGSSIIAHDALYTAWVPAQHLLDRQAQGLQLQGVLQAGGGLSCVAIKR